VTLQQPSLKGTTGTLKRSLLKGYSQFSSLEEKKNGDKMSVAGNRKEAKEYNVGG